MPPSPPSSSLCSEARPPKLSKLPSNWFIGEYPSEHQQATITLVSLAWTLALRIILIISSIQCKTHQIQEVIGIHLLCVAVCGDFGVAFFFPGPQTNLTSPTQSPPGKNRFFGFHPSCCSQIQVLDWKLQNSHEHLRWWEEEPVGHHLWVNRDPVLVSREPYITGKHFLSSTLNILNMLLTGKTFGGFYQFYDMIYIIILYVNMYIDVNMSVSFRATPSQKKCITPRSGLQE